MPAVSSDKRCYSTWQPQFSSSTVPQLLKGRHNSIIYSRGNVLEGAEVGEALRQNILRQRVAQITQLGLLHEILSNVRIGAPWTHPRRAGLLVLRHDAALEPLRRRALLALQHLQPQQRRSCCVRRNYRPHRHKQSYCYKFWTPKTLECALVQGLVTRNWSHLIAPSRTSNWSNSSWLRSMHNSASQVLLTGWWMISESCRNKIKVENYKE